MLHHGSKGDRSHNEDRGDIELAQGELRNAYPACRCNIAEVDESVLNYEPHLALFAKNGIDYYDIILKNAHNVMNKDSIIAFEFNYDQKDKIQDLIKLYIPNSTFKFYKDFDDKWRYVIINYCANE